MQKLGRKSAYNELRKARTLLLPSMEASSGQDENPVTLDATVEGMLDISSDQVLSADAALAQGDLIVGDGTPNLAFLNVGSAHQIIKVNAGGTDPAYASFDWDDLAAAAAADMVHDHSTAAEGGELPLASLGDYTRGDLIIGGVADWDDLAVGAANSVLTADGTDPSWSTTPTVDDLFLTDGGTVGISGNELLTFNAAGNIAVSGADFKIADDQDLTLGTDDDATIRYDEAGDNRVEIAGADWYFGIDQIDILSANANRPILNIENINADAAPAALRLTKNSASPADDDDLGAIDFYGEDSGGNNTRYAYVLAESADVTNGDEAGALTFRVRMDNTDRTLLDLIGYNGSVNQGEVVVNRENQDVDFRVEVVGIADALEVQGSDGQITLGALGAGVVQSTAGGVLSSGTIDVGDISDLAYAAPALSFGTANDVGTADTVMRTDATLALFDATNPTTISVGSTAAVGSAGVAPRRDHSHGITTSSNPGAAASILATGASGELAITGNLDVGEYIRHIGDTDTYLRYQADRITLRAGGIDLIDVIENGANTYTDFHSKVLVENYIYHDDENSGILFSANTLSMWGNIGGANQVSVQLDGVNGRFTVSNDVVFSDGLIVNEDGDDHDFRVESDTNTHALFVQGSDGNVGFGTSTPIEACTVAGRIASYTASPIISGVDSGVPTVGGSISIFYGAGRVAGSTVFGGGVIVTAGENWANGTNSGTSLRFIVSENGTWNTRAEAMRIEHDGKVGIGTQSPAGQTSIDQSDTSGAIPVLELDQADLSEEFINFISSVGDGYPVDTTNAVGTAYARLRVAVNGTFKYIQLYNA